MEKPTFTRNVFAGENTDEWAARFYEAACQTGQLFRSDSSGLIYIDGATAPQRILNDSDFYGVAHSVINVVQVAHRDGEDIVSAAFLEPWKVRVLFAHTAKKILPEIRSVVTDPVVVPLGDGSYGMVPPGFDTRYGSGIFYYVRPGQRPVTPQESTRHLSALFSGVPFADVRFRNNLLAWMLGGVCYDKRLDAPLLVVTGNTQGIGKSSCVQAVGHILHGSIPAPIDFHPSEFMKQLSTRFLENERLLFLDNIVTSRGRSFDNSHLSSLLTQGPSKRIRILGHSRSVTASGILFAASLNDAKLSTDLSDRSLLVKLYRENTGPMSPYCRDYAIEHREEIYGELLGLALRPAGAARIGSPQFRFRRWLEFTIPRIAPAFGDLYIEDNASIDELSMEFFNWGADRLDYEFAAKEFVDKTNNDAGNKYPALFDKLSAYPSDRAKVTWAGIFLKGKVNQYFSPAPGLKLRLLQLQKKSEKDQVLYQFVEVKEE